MESFVGESFEIVEIDNALSYWELVGASDAGDSDYEFEICSFDDGVASLRSSVSASPSLSHSVDRSIDLTGPIEPEEEDRGTDFGDRCDIGVDVKRIDLEMLSVMHDLALSFSANGCGDDLSSIVCDDEYDEEEEYGDDQDLDDELVPWSVAGKFGRQRMRKLGKRCMSNSRKALHNHVKPGCLHGKHGLGVKHSV